MKLNKSLVIGCLILLMLLVITLFPSMFTDINPYGVQTLKYSVSQEDTDKLELRKAPFEPSVSSVFGTDEIGRDIFTFIIYGTRLTLKIAFFVTIFRFLLAVPIGIFAGFGNSMSKTVIRQLNILFNGLPSLLFAILILNLSIFTSLDKRLSTIAFILILTFVGWSKLAQTLEDLTKLILDKPFITSEYAIGKNRYEVSVENVIPHLMPEITVLLFMEMARVLTMMIQLGIFSVFIGNLKLVSGTDQGVIVYRNISFEPEWASLLGSARTYLRSAPWMIIYPSIAFFISVLGFNLFGEGLRINIQDKNSMFVPKVRKFLMAVLIKRKMKFSYKYLLLFAVIISAVISNNKTTDKLNGAYDFIDIPDKLIIGMPEIETVADELSKEMKDIGLIPLYDDYKKYYDIDEMYTVRESIFAVNGYEYLQDTDYSIVSFGSFDVSEAVLVDTSDISLFALEDFNRFKDKVVLIDEKYYNDESIDYFLKMFEEAECKAIIISTSSNIATSVGIKSLKIPIIKLNDINKVENEDKITIKYSSEKLIDKGINVIGIIPGNDQKISEECILIGLPLNYLKKDDGLTTYKYSLELMKELSESSSSRSIIFAFFDGNYSKELHGLMDYSKKMIFAPLKTIMYLDLINIEYGNDNVVYIDDEQAPSTRFFGVSFLQTFNKSKDLNIVEYKIPTPEELIDYGDDPHLKMFSRKGVTTLVMDIRASADSFFEALLSSIMLNN